MPYKDKARQLEYQRQWMADRRAAWFSENGPCIDCGSGDELELDHIDQSTKISHRIWSWCEERRIVELAKCAVRCHDCHVIKTNINKEQPRGEDASWSVLTNNDVIKIRNAYSNGSKQTDLARQYGVIKQTIWEIVHGKIWKHLL